VCVCVCVCVCSARAETRTEEAAERELRDLDQGLHICKGRLTFNPRRITENGREEMSTTALERRSMRVWMWTCERVQPSLCAPAPLNTRNPPREGLVQRCVCAAEACDAAALAQGLVERTAHV
jgi:hypothetical protein